MWRFTFAFMSALTLAVAFTTSVLADSHPAPATSGGGGAATTAPVVTSTPNTGVGTLAEQIPTVFLLGLIGIAGVFALLALVTARQGQHA